MRAHKHTREHERVSGEKILDYLIIPVENRFPFLIHVLVLKSRLVCKTVSEVFTWR